MIRKVVVIFGRPAAIIAAWGYGSPRFAGTTTWGMRAAGGIMPQLQSAFGVFALLAIAWAFGENRRAVSLRQAAIGLVVTILTAVVLIKLPFVAQAFGIINDAVGAISAASRAVPAFRFGYLD